ncbi:hypothetical protein [Rhodopila globiformis]|uniref:Uncharacterized protein n=1 Tax=Rhodopila globiformis TaxID=1071 RepID=A0A2S6NHH3_RHOGL|nr:hypothetical protein [Rhodopila globiformis]PPQ34078.1 hypothetical protein CCS01_12510 [Rhodopila globiformis]
MRRCTRPSKLEQTEEAIRRAGSIGALERLARIGGAPEQRAAFWQPFCKLPSAQGLDAGVEELKRIIRSNEHTATKRDTRPASSPRHA